MFVKLQNKFLLILTVGYKYCKIFSYFHSTIYRACRISQHFNIYDDSSSINLKTFQGVRSLSFNVTLSDTSMVSTLDMIMIHIFSIIDSTYIFHKFFPCLSVQLYLYLPFLIRSKCEDNLKFVNNCLYNLF